MSHPADHNRWLAGCRTQSNRGHHLSAGDIFYLGLSDYTESMRCPNGLPVDRSPPCENPVWRRMVDKARQDSQERSRHIAMMDRMATVTMDDVETFLSEVRRWARSLRHPRM